LIIGECTLDTIRVVAKTIMVKVFLEIYMSILVPVGGFRAQTRKMLVVEEP
jgi:hypothetical protein